jgi:hypothetical protein
MTIASIASPPIVKGERFLPERVEIGNFKPFAFYDSFMDCIRVMILDRSITEERVDDFLTIYQTNHPTPFDAKHCGFCLKGIRHWFDELGLEEGAELLLADLINRIVEKNPQSTMAKILGCFPADELVVEWPQFAQAA